ncbi:pseudouridine synthase [Betaproteobacteria bacterium SCN2]|jgi:16S rRNA pseudouridine516 synthase|nr:pseudouridine synthase [Betaproteobacteria bacterium SCN2]
MNLTKLLQSQGFGTRRECRALVMSGRVGVAGEEILNPDAEVAEHDLIFTVDGKDWRYREKAYVMLHKPSGYECSQKPKHYPSVLGLLPTQLRNRGLQTVGRLDEDTTGLLLLTDDGQFLHVYTSPRKSIEKVYRATVKHPLSEEQLNALRKGVVLHDDPEPVAAQSAVARDAHTLELTLTGGKYHQVKRMVAAAGNRVEALHRERMGAYSLPDDLAPGEWCYVEPDTAR